MRSCVLVLELAVPDFACCCCRCLMNQNELKFKIERAEAAAAHAQQVYEKTEPGSSKDSCLKLLLAKEKALEQLREKDLLQQRTAGVGENHC